MRAWLISNPNASTANARVRDALADVFSEQLDLHVVDTRARDHATDLAQQAVEQGVDAVFALGGDGTANEVMQAVAGTEVALGLLPGGGTNVLARALGLPNDPHLAAVAQLATLRTGTGQRLGLGEANGRLFGFQAGIGLDASIVARVEASPRMKRSLRQLAFVLLGFREWATNEDRSDPAAALVDVDGAPPQAAGLPASEQLLIVAGNLDPYTYLGPRPFHLTPGATPHEALELVTVAPMPTWRVLRALARAFDDGSHTADPGVMSAQDVRSCTIESSRPVNLMVDGEHVGRPSIVTIRYRPNLLKTLVERQMDGRERALSDPPQVG